MKKKLCDLLSRERIIGADTIPQALELIVKYKDKLSIIVANIRMLRGVLSKQIIPRLCKKLSINMLPIVGFYKHTDEVAEEEFVSNIKGHKPIKFDESNLNFPEQYIRMIKEVYPELNVDISKANEIWLKDKKTEDLVDLRKWLEDEGFLSAKAGSKIEAQKKTATVQQPTSDKARQDMDYKQMYIELKKKYDELLKYVKELTESI